MDIADMVVAFFPGRDEARGTALPPTDKNRPHKMLVSSPDYRLCACGLKTKVEDAV